MGQMVAQRAQIVNMMQAFQQHQQQVHTHEQQQQQANNQLQQQAQQAQPVEAIRQATVTFQEAAQRIHEASNHNNDDEQLPPVLLKALNKQKRKLEANMRSVIHAKKKLEEESEKHTFSENHKGDIGRYPSGVRPFRCNDHMVEIHDPYEAAMEEDVPILITIPKGAKRKEAAHIIHHACAVSTQKVRFDVAKARKML